MRRKFAMTVPLTMLMATADGLLVQATAADMEARSRIDAVTIYPDAASVTRIMEVDIPAGSTTLYVRGLPSSVDPDSLRVSGTSEGKIAVGTIETRRASPDQKPDTGVELRLKTLNTDREAWRSTLSALTAKQDMILLYSKSSPDKLTDGEKSLEPGQWTSAFDTIGNALARVGDSIREAQARLKEIEADIATIELARTRPQPRQALRDIAITVEAAMPAKGKLALNYLVRGAQWHPSYDIALDTSGTQPKKTVQLSRRASVTQNTGEDWSDITLTLSTTRTARGAAAPDVKATLAELTPEQPPVTMAGGKATAVSTDSENVVADIPPRRGPEEMMLVRPVYFESNTYQATFTIDRRISAPSGMTAKSFELSTRTAQAELFLKTAPALQQAAFIEAHLTNDDAAPLLAGPMTIRRDGMFAGKGVMAEIPPGDSFDVGFGVDDSIRVVRTLVKRRENEPPPSGSKSDSREFRTTIRNLHDFPVRITLTDRIPYSENTAVTVELLGQTTPPAVKQVGDKRGVMSWTYDLKPQQEVETKLAWRMRWPAGRQILLDQSHTFRFSSGGVF